MIEVRFRKIEGRRLFKALGDAPGVKEGNFYTSKEVDTIIGDLMERAYQSGSAIQIDAEGDTVIVVREVERKPYAPES